MGGALLPPDYEAWETRGRSVVARRDVADAVRLALAAGTLYGWAAAQPGREVFQGRGETYGVSLGPVRAVVRHARRGGLMRRLSADRFMAAAPRFRREVAMAERLRAAGVATPAVLAGVAYAAGITHTADVATERVDGRDLAAVFFEGEPPSGARRAALWHSVASLVRRLHQAGLVHPDLQLRNVLVTEPGTAAGGPAAWLLDVDTVRPARLRPGAARSANLARFFRSWDKWNAGAGGPRLTAADRDAFLAAYGAPPA